MAEVKTQPAFLHQRACLFGVITDKRTESMVHQVSCRMVALSPPPLDVDGADDFLSHHDTLVLRNDSVKIEA